MEKKRLDRDNYYLTVLEAVKQRSTCSRGRSGAIIVKEGRIISTGYVGAPAGMPHCDEVGHQLEKRILVPNGDHSIHCIRTVHAELNAILQAARFGVSIEGGVMYCTMVPCFECAKAIHSVGIVKVIAMHPYQGQGKTIFFLKDIKIPLIILNKKELY